MVHICSLEHAPYEDPVCIPKWQYIWQIILQSFRLYEGDKLPDPVGLDLLLIIGGFLNIYEDVKFLWLGTG